MVAAILLMSACRTQDTDLTDVASMALDPQPALDIAGTTPDGANILSDPVGGTRLSTGTIVVADRGDHVIRYLDRNGQLTHSVGREGSGPGEFREVTWLGQCRPDTVFVWDRLAGRMTVLAADGVVLRTFPITPTPTTLTCSPSGTLAYFGPPDALPASMADVEHADLQGPLFLIGDADSTPRIIDTLVMGQSRPLGRVTALALTTAHLFVGTAQSDEIGRYQWTGEAEPPLFTGIAPRPATAQHFERAIEIQLSIFRDAAARSMIGQMLRRMSTPEFLPAYHAIFPDPTGILWVVVSTPGDTTTWLRGLTPASGLAADLRMPGEVRVFEVGVDYLLGSRESAEGVPHVVQFRLRRDGTP